MLSNIKSMVRTFYPVGQGAFYRERFIFKDNKIFNIVYDCGSETTIGKSNISRIINNWGNERLDILFISHFHEDHISAVKELIDKTQPRLLVAPYLTSLDKNYLKIDVINRCLYKKTNDINYNQIENVFSAINDIKSFCGDNVDEFKLVAKEKIFENNNVDIVDEEELSHILNNKIYSNSWILDAFVSSIKHENFIIEEFTKEFGGIENINSIEKIKEILENKEQKKRLKKVYGNRINDLSLVLFSVPTDINVHQCYCNLYNLRSCKVTYGHNCYSMKCAGCLYTGDYNTNNEENYQCLINHLDKYRDRIGCLQLPHHGSDRSFNDIFMDLNCFYIACFGRNNKYKHPGANTIYKIVMNRKPLFMIDEETKKVVFRISFM